MAEGSIVAVATSLVSIVGALLVAFLTARWQVRASDKVKASERRYALYDQAVEMLLQLEKDPALSLDDAFLSRWYLLVGRTGVYASKAVASEVAEFGNRLRDNFEAFEASQAKLHDRWFESEDICSEDGRYHDIYYRLVGGEEWQYDEARRQLQEQSWISSAEIADAVESVSCAIRKECGLS